MQTHYKTLGVFKEVSLTQLKARYRALASEHHPDKVLGSVKKKEKATGIFAEITGAYAVLSDAKRKKQYDDELAILSSECSACRGSGCTYRGKGFTHRTETVCGVCEGSGRTFSKNKVTAKKL